MTPFAMRLEAQGWWFAALIGLAACQDVDRADRPTVGEGASDEPQGPAEPTDIGEEEVDAILAGGIRAPHEVLAQMARPVARATPTLEDTQATLTAERMRPVTEALTAAGWNEDEQLALVHFAGLHLSAAEGDSTLRARSALHEQAIESIEGFSRELDALEREHDIEIDREALRERGVLLSHPWEVEG